MRRIVLLGLALLLALETAPCAEPGKEEARLAAQRFGDALMSAKAANLKPLLPARGTVHLALKRLAQEDGAFGAAQVEAVLHEALTQVTVRAFEVIRVEGDARTFVAHGRADLTDGGGRPCRVSFHLQFQPEDDAWVLREIKETQE